MSGATTFKHDHGDVKTLKYLGIITRCSISLHLAIPQCFFLVLIYSFYILSLRNLIDLMFWLSLYAEGSQIIPSAISPLNLRLKYPNVC